MKTEPERGMKWLPLAIGAGLALAAVVLLVTALFSEEIFPEYSPAHRGLEVARRAGCFSCHGSGAQPASPNPELGEAADQFGAVPSMFDERLEPEELRQWIAHGITDERAQSESFMRSRKQHALSMPSFSDRLSSSEIADLTAYLALMQYRESVSDRPSSTSGEYLARQYACFSCHGELGQGGIENPGSLKGYIPGFFGSDFRALTRNGNQQDLQEWIQHGVSDFFFNQGFAGVYPGRFFNNRQAIRMPAYKGFLTEAEMTLLIDFLLELLELGPLEAESILRYRPIDSASPPRRDRDSGQSAQTRVSAGNNRLSTEVGDILKNNCLRCHGPEKQRSGYRLDEREAALKGGEIAEFLGDAAIEPGNSSRGLFIRFIEAENEDPMQEIYPMPPEDNPRLSPTEVQKLRQWIDAGAPWPSDQTLTP